MPPQDPAASQSDPEPSNVSAFSEGRTSLRILCLGDGFTTAALRQLAWAEPTGDRDGVPNMHGIEVRTLSRRMQCSAPHGGDLPDLFVPDLIVDTIPPVREGGRLLNPLYRDSLDAFPDAVFIHLSSTSVYATEGVDSVDELSVPFPDDRGQARLDLEEAILSVRPLAVILRCGGIYGPGRCLPLSLSSGQSRHVSFDENRYVARIHVYDLSRLIVAVGRALLSAGAGVRKSHAEFTSLFPGRQRRNLICAVDPFPSAVSETLRFIHDEWGIAVPAMPEGPARGRRVRSLYAGPLLGDFSFPDYRAGFRHAMRGWSRA